MFEERESVFDSKNTLDLVLKYESFLRESKSFYFDVEQFEDIIDYYFEKEDYESAENAIQTALIQHPTAVSIQLMQSEYWIDSQKITQALDLLSNIESFEPNNCEVFLLRGVAYLGLQNRPKALACFNQAIEYCFEDVHEIYYYTGYYLMIHKHFEHAIKYLTEALHIEPSFYSPYLELGYCYDSLNQLNKSIDCYLQYTNNEPFNADAWVNLGLVYGKMEKYDEAIDAFDFALAINPQIEGAIFNKANALAHSGAYEKALPLFEDLLLSDNQNAELYCSIGECYEKLFQPEKANQNFHLSIQLNPNLPEAWLGLGINTSILGNNEESIKYLTQALLIENSNPDVWFTLGKIYMKQGNTAAAADCFAKVTILDPLDFESWMLLSEISFLNNDIEQAIENLKIALSSNSNISILNFRMAAFYMCKGNKNKCLAYFENGLKIDFFTYCEFLKFYPLGLQIDEIAQLIKQYKNSAHQI
jgi:tetratricopeptide (TPR) repeat protein